MEERYIFTFTDPASGNPAVQELDATEFMRKNRLAGMNDDFFKKHIAPAYAQSRGIDLLGWRREYVLSSADEEYLKVSTLEAQLESAEEVEEYYPDEVIRLRREWKAAYDEWAAKYPVEAANLAARSNRTSVVNEDAVERALRGHD